MKSPDGEAEVIGSHGRPGQRARECKEVITFGMRPDKMLASLSPIFHGAPTITLCPLQTQKTGVALTSILGKQSEP